MSAFFLKNLHVYDSGIPGYLLKKQIYKTPNLYLEHLSYKNNFFCPFLSIGKSGPYEIDSGFIR